VSAALAWIPFLEPLPGVESWWLLLLLPLCFGIAAIHKAMRVPPRADYWRQVMVLSMQLVVGMAALAVGLFLLVQVVLPLLPAE
jgi:hypothetical protein